MGGSDASFPASVSPLVNGSGGSCDSQCLGCRERLRPTLSGRPRELRLPTPPAAACEVGSQGRWAGTTPRPPTMQLRTLPSPWSARGLRSGPEVSGRPFPEAPAKEEGSFLPPPPAVPPHHPGQGHVLSPCHRGSARWGPVSTPSLATGLSSHSATCLEGPSPAAAPSGPLPAPRPPATWPREPGPCLRVKPQGLPDGAPAPPCRLLTSPLLSSHLVFRGSGKALGLGAISRGTEGSGGRGGGGATQTGHLRRRP